MTALSGVWLEVATNGVDLSRDGRSAVVRAVRGIMLSAHRTGVDWLQVENVLSDQNRYALARQFARGRNGKALRSAVVHRQLRALWDETGEVVSRTPTWQAREVPEAIDFIRQRLGSANGLTQQQQRVLQVVLDLAESYNTLRVAAPARVVADRSDMSPATANRVLAQLCRTEWLSLARRGNSKTRRSNLYQLAPSLLDIWGALRAPKSQTPPKSHVPPKSQEEADMSVALTLTASSPEILAEALAVLAERDPERARRLLEGVTPPPNLRVVGGDA